MHINDQDDTATETLPALLVFIENIDVPRPSSSLAFNVRPFEPEMHINKQAETLPAPSVPIEHIDAPRPPPWLLKSQNKEQG